MKILNEFPPIWDQVLAAGMNPNPDAVIFTYGDTIYVPSGNDVPDHLIVHEETHMRQQGDNPDAWWERYIADQYFRLSQEVEAYGNQYAFICKAVKDRNQRHKILRELSSHLSGPTYGNMIMLNDALKMIKDKSGVK